MSKLIVIDASVVLSVVLDELHADFAVQAVQDANLISPESLPFEVTNALSARCRANNQAHLTYQQVTSALDSFFQIPIRLINHDELLHKQALMLAAQRRMYCYDAYMLLLAQNYSASLFTFDGSGKKMGLIQHAKDLNISLVFGG